MALSQCYRPLQMALVVLSWTALLSNGFSGMYFDNGLGQTAIEHLDITDQEQMRQEILTLLGLTHAPNKASPHFIANSNNHTVGCPA